MGRLKTPALLGLLLFIGCAPAKKPDAPAQMLNRPVTDWSSSWTTASIYTDAGLTQAQKEAVSNLEPAGGEGRLGLGFTEDFDGDGRIETVSYGAYEKKTEAGNFVLVTRKESDRTAVLLLQEFPGPPRLTVFTLKPDGSLWFGGGIDAGEVTMSITWDQGTPTFHKLTGD